MNKLRLFLIGVKNGFQEFGNMITNIINFILLFVVYVVAIGLTAIVAKIARKKFLNLKKSKKSYWIHKKIGKRPIEEYYRQF